MVVKLGDIGKCIRNTRKVLICGAGEGWRSVGPILREINYYTEPRRKGMSHVQYKRKANWIGHILRRNFIYLLHGAESFLRS
jgi:hypothetical protein